MSDPKTVSVKIGASRFNIASDDLYLKQFRTGTKNIFSNAFRRIAGTDAFEPRMAHLFSKLIRPTDICLDVGANIGCTAILFSQLAKQVVAFEPTPKTFALLQRNVGNSGLKNITCQNYALGHEDKTATIVFSNENRSGAFVGDSVDGEGDKADILVKRLDSIASSLQLQRIDFLKLDVEGYEGKVIEGGWNTIVKYRPIIQLELNSWCLNAQHRISLPDFIDFLVSRFPFVYGIQRQGYANIREKHGRWLVMRKNILEQRFKEIVVAFDSDRLESFHSAFKEINE